MLCKRLIHHLLPSPLPPAAAFENVVQALYKYVVPKPRAECSKGEQLAVSFAAGYIAGVFCAVVSHPADNLVSKLNATKGVSAGAGLGKEEVGRCAECSVWGWAALGIGGKSQMPARGAYI